MIRSSSWFPLQGTCSLLLLAFGVLIPAQAADLPDAIPQDVSLIARVKDPIGVVSKIKTIAGTLDPSFTGIVDNALNSVMGVGISNPTLEGVEKNGEWWFFVILTKERGPELVFGIPGSDLGAMQDAVGDSFSFVKHDKFGIYSASETAIESVKECIAGKVKSVKDSVSTRAQEVLHPGDFSVLVNLAEISKTFQDEIGEAETSILAEIENAPIAPELGIDLQMLVDIAKKVVKGGFQTVRDANSFSFALSITEENLVIEELLEFKEGSGSEKYLAEHQGGEINLLSKLPPGMPFFLVVNGGYSEMMEFSTSFIRASIQDEAKKKATEEALKGAIEAGVSSMAFGMTLGNVNDGILRFVSLVTAKDIAKMKKSSTDFIKNIGELKFGEVTTSYELQEGAETIGDQKIDTIRINQDFGDEDIGAFQTQMLQTLFGADGMTSRVVYLKNAMVQTQGGGLELMADALKAINESTGKLPGGNTLKMLPTKANIVVLADAGSLVAAGIKMALENAPPGFEFDEKLLDDASSKKAYIGFSVACEKKGLHMKTVVPVDSIQSLYKLGMAMYMSVVGVEANF